MNKYLLLLLPIFLFSASKIIDSSTLSHGGDGTAALLSYNSPKWPNSLLYVLDAPSVSNSTLHIYEFDRNVSSFSNLKELLTISLNSTSANSMALSKDGEYLYVADGDRVDIIDINITTGITVKANIESSLQISGASLNYIEKSSLQHKLFLADDANGVYMVDISNSSAPTLLATLPDPKSKATQKLLSSKDGRYLYVLGQCSGLIVYDVLGSSFELVQTLIAPATNAHSYWDMIFSASYEKIFIQHYKEDGQSFTPYKLSVYNSNDPTTNTLINSVSLQGTTYHQSMQLSPDGNTLLFQTLTGQTIANNYCGAF
jgi:hypothetical protein